ncbi:hypothetical protein FZEAL_2133 [Fusarium zealandicum]|uniref:Uncharacterized protein n=1 Tax=Fusarium zealandicum TaxID=1053134 RepID=A0A8H4XN44_9HYPO|nr:hypothetical protein FZEAL_2133 [Fusarium zealandicum]
MDLEHSRPGPTSQNSLHSTYQAPERSSNLLGPRSTSRQRLPYQSLNETSALLRSPGPLESMLKTTTETGDIGIFSIKPPVPSVTYRHPQRPRPNPKGLKRPSRLCSREVENGPVYDDRKSLPSYRDTASEIISLYGSAAQPSYSRSFSPSLDDGQRSYSLTTCSSRRIPSCKSSGTFQSLSSNSGLQRPRSPFPYPTRLKRPGIRPASPAMSDNGVIDYSLVVLICNSAQYMGLIGREVIEATVVIPLFLCDLNSVDQPPRCLHRRLPGLIITYQGLAAQEHQARCHTGDHDHSSDRLAPANKGMHPNRNGQPLRSAGSFYYDYTEEFDTDGHYELEYAVPLCPIPQRAEGFRQPMLLRADGADPMGRAGIPYMVGPGTRNFKVNHYDNPTGEDMESQSPADSDKASHPTTHNYQSSHDAASSRNSSTRSTNTLDPWGILAQARRELRSEIQKPGYLSSHAICRRSKTLGAKPMDSDIERPPHSALPGEDYSLGSAVAERGSVVPFFETNHKVQLFDEVEGNDAAPREKPQGDALKMRVYPRSRKRPFQGQGQVKPLKMRIYRGNHRRRPAATDITFSNDPKPTVTVARPEVQQENTDTHILSPNPISAAHQLRVTNSIPQLMKALPPLPDEAHKAVEQAQGTPSTEPEVSTRLLFSSPVNASAPTDSQPNANLVATKSHSCDDSPVPASRQHLQANHSRFKVRLRLSRSTGFQKQNLDLDAVPERSSSNPIKPRLRLKASRNKMNQKPIAQDGTVVRRVGLRQYNSLLELKHFPQKDMLTDRSSFGEALEEHLAQLGTGANRLSSIDESARSNQRHRLSDQFDIPYPLSPRGIELATPVTQLQSKRESLTPSIGQTKNQKVVGKNMSFLRPRVATAARVRKQTRISGSYGSDPTPLRPNIAHDSSFDDSEVGVGPTGLTPPRRSRNKARRVRHWASEAKRVVRSYVRKTLNRSWHSEN